MTDNEFIFGVLGIALLVMFLIAYKARKDSGF